jgi:hypothetical protein
MEGKNSIKVMEPLKEGEVVCPECNGSGGQINYIGDPRDLKVVSKVCLKCLGEGKLDWVELVVGKKVYNPYNSIVIPLLRAHYPKLIAKELISIQPITSYRR